MNFLSFHLSKSSLLLKNSIGGKIFLVCSAPTPYPLAFRTYLTVTVCSVLAKKITCIFMGVPLSDDFLFSCNFQNNLSSL